jgi:thioredoxin-related protein
MKFILFIIILLTTTTSYAKDFLFYFQSEQCSYCRKLEQHFNDNQIQALIKEYRFVKIDTNSEWGGKLTRAYSVNLYPTLMVVRSVPHEGKNKGIVLRKQVGYIPLEQFREFLKISPKTKAVEPITLIGKAI